MKKIKIEINYDDENGSLTNPFSFLMRVIVFMRKLGFIIGIKFENEVLRGEEPTLEYIKKKVYTFYNLSTENAEQTLRNRELVIARQTAHFFSKRLTRKSLATIGREIGDKDHATVLHSCRTIQNLMDTNKIFKMNIEELEGKFKL